METPGTSPSNANRNDDTVLRNYRDHAQATFPSDTDVVDLGGDDDKRNGPRGGAGLHFPIKLHVMLSNAEDHGLSHIVSWQPHGRCFVVHKPKEFVTEVLPIYFRQTKLSSFKRQLLLYGFCRITTGKDCGGYYHELFLRHKLFLCHDMTRTHARGTGIRGKASPRTEPDFYSMPWVKPGCASVASNRDPEGEVAAATEENERSEPAERQDLSDHSLLIAQSLREPILTRSSSSSSLSVVFQPDETVEINPDTTFTEFGDWEIGGVDVDIDAEFKKLGGC